MKNKTSGDLDKKNPVTVECIDLSVWISETFSADDHITLLMDIEGAEYDVLEKMVADNSIGIIDVLYVEFHAHKMVMDVPRHVSLIKNLMSIETLDLRGDFKPSKTTPQMGRIEEYVSKQYLKGCEK